MTEAEIQRLESEDQLEEAARLAQQLGLHARASGLFERACAFEDAARSSLAAEDYARAFELSAMSQSLELEAQALTLLLQDAASAKRVAANVEARGQHASAARLWLGLDEPKSAARCFESAAELASAANAYASAEDPRNAARCLEALLRASPDRHSARLSLGKLLADHGRARAAVRNLQSIPDTAPEYGPALGVLAHCFEALGMREAIRGAEHKLETLGIAAAAEALSRETVPELETVLFGRYRVVREVARTPTARVLEATDRITNARVALKIFSISTLRDSGRDALRRFEREAEVLSSLRHPAVLELLAYLPDGPAVVLPWMSGGSLSDVLSRGPMAPARAAEITIAVLSALGEAHRRGILHRDVKPANVLFDEAGGARLADFGTAHVSDAAVTVTAGVIGTLGYMAPEQRGGAPANVKSDVYGAGAVLVHTLTGAPPDADLPLLSREFTADHVAIVERLTGPEAQRPQDTQEAIELLRSVSWPTDVPPPRPDTALTAPRPPTPGLRLQEVGGGRYRDITLERSVLMLRAEAGVLERVLAFARADDPCLASVLSYKAEDQVLWIEDVDTAEPTGPLSAEDRADLARALEALHRAGGAHGAVNRQHLGRCGGQLILHFPRAPEHHDATRDLLDLSQL